MIADRILIDTGPLVATYRARDQYHAVYVDLWRELSAPQFSCWPVITEAIYLLGDSREAVQKLLAKISSGDIVILPIAGDDIPAIAELMAEYFDQGIDFADACLIHLAERESIGTIFSVDRRHFSVYRTAGGNALSLLPMH